MPTTDPIALAIHRHDAAEAAGELPHPHDQLAVDMLVAADSTTVSADDIPSITRSITTAIESAQDHPEEALVREVLGMLLIAVEGGEWGEVQERAEAVRNVAAWVCETAAFES